MMPTNRFTSANGIVHHYLDYGGTEKPSVICLHGLTRNAWDFDSVGRLLSPYYHVRAVDVRGRGDSEWGRPEQYRLTTYVDDLRALLDEWKVESTSLIGTSMGGLIAMLFAAREPDRVTRLVLNDIGPEVAPLGLRRILETVGSAPPKFDSRESLVAYLRSTLQPLETLPDAEVWRFAESSVKSSSEGRWTWKLDPAVRAEVAEGDPRLIAPELWTELARTKGDVLVLRGERSDVLSREICRRMVEERAYCRWVEVPGVGHAPLLSEPEATRAIREFFHLPLFYRSMNEHLEYAE